jgi:hypothetical protein
LESKGGAIAMITSVPSDSLALKILMMHSLKTILFGSTNIPLLLKLYEYQKQQSKQRYKKCFLFRRSRLNASNT